MMSIKHRPKCRKSSWEQRKGYKLSSTYIYHSFKRQKIQKISILYLPEFERRNSVIILTNNYIHLFHYCHSQNAE